MTDIVAYTPPAERRDWVELMEPAAKLATSIATTEFVPTEFRNKPAAIAACVLYGAELGLGPMVALAKISIIKGKPAPSAELGRALAFGAGHQLWIEDSTDTKVTWSGHRKGSQHVVSFTWTMDRVRKAGLAGNPAYNKFPQQMLSARASAELVRAICPEVLGGITMFAEEFDDVESVNGHVVAAEPTKATTKRKRGGVATEPPPAEPIEAESTETPEPQGDGPTAPQTRKVMALFHEVGVEDRDERLQLTSAFVGRDVESWNDLTKDEAASVIDKLESQAQARQVDNEPPLPDELDLG